MYVQYQPGISSAASYPYMEDVRHKEPYKCQYQQASSIGSTTGYGRIRPGNETLLRDVVAAVGPVVFALNSEVETFLNYG
jgi:Papain family cysteine protease